VSKQASHIENYMWSLSSYGMLISK